MLAVGFIGAHGDFGGIDDADVGGAHGGRDGGLLELGEHGVVKLAVGIDFALEDVVLDGFFAFAGDLLSLGVIGGLEELFAAEGILKFVFDAAEDGGAVVFEGGLEDGEFGLEAADLIVIGGVDGAEVGDLGVEVADFGGGVAEGGVVEDVGEGVGAGGLGEFEGGLAGDAGGGGGGEFGLEHFEFFFGDVGFFVGEEEAGLAGVLLEVIFGAFELDAHVVELVGEPLGGFFGGFPAGFEVLIDEFGGDGVDEERGEGGVGGIGGDFDDAGLAGGAGFEGFDGIGELLVEEGGLIGVGDAEEVTPVGEAGGIFDGGRGGFDLVGGGADDGFGLDDFDLGGDFGGVGAGFVDFGVLAHVHEVFVEALDFDGGVGLADGGLGDGGEETDDSADEGEDEPGGFLMAEDAPVFEEAAGFGIGVVLRAVAIAIGGGVAITVGGAADEGAALGIVGFEGGIVRRGAMIFHGR